MIDVHFWPTANGLKIAILLEELELPHRLLPVNIRAGEQHAADFQAISANGRIPAIVDHQPATGEGPLALFESGAILSYLAGKAGRFQGGGDPWRVQQWLFWQVGHVTPYLSQLQVLREKAPEPQVFAQQLLQREAERLYGVLERRLASAEYVAGDYSIADMAIFPWIQPRRQGLALADFPQLAAWRERLKARPAIQRAYARGRALAPSEASLNLE